MTLRATAAPARSGSPRRWTSCRRASRSSSRSGGCATMRDAGGARPQARHLQGARAPDRAPRAREAEILPAAALRPPQPPLLTARLLIGHGLHPRQVGRAEIVAHLAEQRGQLAAMVGLVVEQMAREEPARPGPRAAVDAAGPGERVEPRLGEAFGPVENDLVDDRARGAELFEISYRSTPIGAITYCLPERRPSRRDRRTADGRACRDRFEEGAAIAPALGIVDAGADLLDLLVHRLIVTREGPKDVDVRTPSLPAARATASLQHIAVEIHPHHNRRLLVAPWSNKRAPATLLHDKNDKRSATRWRKSCLRRGLSRWAAPGLGSAQANAPLSFGSCKELRDYLDSLEPYTEVLLAPAVYECREPVNPSVDGLTVDFGGSLVRVADHALRPGIVVGDLHAPPQRHSRGVRVLNVRVDGNRAHQAYECWGGPCDAARQRQSLPPAAGQRHHRERLRRLRSDQCRGHRRALRRGRGGERATFAGRRPAGPERSHFDGLAGYWTYESTFRNVRANNNDYSGFSFDLDFSGNRIERFEASGNRDHGLFLRHARANSFEQGTSTTTAATASISIAPSATAPTPAPGRRASRASRSGAPGCMAPGSISPARAMPSSPPT